MPKLERRSFHHWLLLLGLIIFWGSSFAITKLTTTEQSLEWTVAIRLTVGALLIYGVLRYQGLVLPLQKKYWHWFLWLGAVGSLIPFLLITWGTNHISSGMAGVSMAIIPLFVAFAGHFILKDEPLTRKRLGGLVIGFIGLVILMNPSLSENGSTDSAGYIALLAKLAVLLAALSYGIQAITARMSPPMHPLQKAAGTHIAAAIGSLVIALFFSFDEMSHISAKGFFLASLLGIFPTALAGIILFYLLEKAGAGFVSLSNYLIPPYALFFGILTMSEPFQWHSLAGLILILAGIALSEKQTTA